jgi:hypothetical protein
MLTLSLLVLFLSPQVAHAERLESTILLKQQKRLVTILHQEPGEPQEIRIDADVYSLRSVDPAGLGTGFNYSADRPGEAVSILQDQILLSKMKANPLQFSRNLHLRNADEVACPRDSNAILMIIQNPSAERIGNCLKLERR